MLFLRASLAFVLSAALLASPALGATKHHATKHHTTAKKTTKSASKVKRTSTSKRRHVRRSRVRRLRGQQAIEPQRVREIQLALIRENYLSGDPDGNWDERTKAAMQKFQADQGWQTKLMPDSRALKKLGLGPDYSNAINAKGSTFGDPPPIKTIPSDQAAGFEAASGVSE